MAISGLVDRGHLVAPAARFVEDVISVAIDFYSKHDALTVHAPIGGEKVELVLPSGERVSRLIADSFCRTVDTDLVAGRILLADSRYCKHLPLPTWDARHHQPTGQLMLPTQSCRVAFDPTINATWVMSQKAKTVVMLVPSLGELPGWSLVTPLRVGLSWIADQTDGEFIHGAVVARKKRGVLLAGPSGVGKSTLALRLAKHGWSFLTDDFCMLRGRTAHAVYGRAKLWRDSAETLGLALDNEFQDDLRLAKEVIAVNELDWAELLPEAKIAAVASPSLTSFTKMHPTDKRSAFMSLAPPTLAGLQGGSLGSFRRLADFLNDLPTWRFGAIGDIEELSDALARAIGLKA